MKIRKLSVFAVLAITLLLSSCDVTTLLDTFKGNAYEDVFDLDLVGAQAEEAVNSVMDAAEAEDVDEGDAVDSSDNVVAAGIAVVPVPKGVIPKDIPAASVAGGLASGRITGSVAIVDGKVPKLPKQDKAKKDELKSIVGTALSGTGEKDFLDKLKTPAIDAQILAAHNTAIMVYETLDDIANFLGLDTELGSLIASIRDGLNIELPVPPAVITLQEILNIQAASNLANSLSNLLTVASGADVDID